MKLGKRWLVEGWKSGKGGNMVKKGEKRLKKPKSLRHL